ncbi:transcriptional regulator [Acinetobacter sp. IRS14]|uniref:transcriptional regulator n=1 Tax=Acinetobacter sp. IRS14 TaxID=2983398 RepID=UPI002AFECA5F|nr:transcriptional regulator [Acinetobacter sp. IRS14]MEA1231096.1 transcriptional regulator [Acinetobacter sp. IRS14]
MSKRLNSTDKIESGDQFVLYKANCSDFRGLPQDLLLDWIKENQPEPPESGTSPIVQHFNPYSNFILNVENHPEGTYLLLNPSSGIENGTIKLPVYAEVSDKQMIIFTCSQQITNFTVDGNGAAVVGAPNAIHATGFFSLQFDKLSGTWYRRG